MDEEIDLHKEMHELDTQIQEMLKHNPEYAGVHEMVFGGESSGDVVYLPRVPTAEEVELAMELAKKR